MTGVKTNLIPIHARQSIDGRWWFTVAELVASEISKLRWWLPVLPPHVVGPGGYGACSFRHTYVSSLSKWQSDCMTCGVIVRGIYTLCHPAELLHADTVGTISYNTAIGALYWSLLNGCLLYTRVGGSVTRLRPVGLMHIVLFVRYFFQPLRLAFWHRVWKKWVNGSSVWFDIMKGNRLISWIVRAALFIVRSLVYCCIRASSSFSSPSYNVE